MSKLVETPFYLATSEAAEVCWYCGVPLTEPIANKKHASTTRTKDHIVPRSLGGQGTVWACNRCNKKKGALTLEQFREIVRPGEGDIRLFYGELRDKELRHKPEKLTCREQRKLGLNKRFNDTLAEKLKKALGVEP